MFTLAKQNLNFVLACKEAGAASCSREHQWNSLGSKQTENLV